METRGERFAIREVRVRNFKSIRETSFALSSFSCLIGPNNSGKTNVLDALRVLSEASREDLRPILQRMGGLTKLRNFAASEKEAMRLGLTVEISVDDTTTWTFTYDLELDVDGRVRKERLSLREGESERRIFDTKRVAGHNETHYLNADNAERVTQLDARQLTLAAAGSESVWGSVFRDFLRRMRFFRFSPDRLKALGQATESKELARDGSNFASYVHSVQSRHRKTFQRIEDQLINAFPDIEELASPLVGSQTVLGVREKWFSQLTEGEQLSDGLVGYLAHIVAIYGPDNPSVLIFEEPENYVHARLMERLVQTMKGASRSTQIVITTHSVTLLNLLELDDIRVVSREDGGTIVQAPPDSTKLRHALKEWGLGDAYFAGVLGGVPG